MVDGSQIADGLVGVLSETQVKTDAAVLSQYAVDGVKPKAVVFPSSTRQVADVITYANEKKLAVVPCGGGSKLSMGNPPKRLDVVLCTTRMNHMTDVDTANLTLTVEAGVKFLDIQARLATEDDRCYLPLEDLTTDADEVICSDRSHSGCFLPIDAPYSSSATIGGIIASNSSGPRRLLYNLPRDIILGSRFVAANGDIIGTGGKTVKNVSGYDISKLMVGSSGSLGVLCEMTLRLLPLPEEMETLLFSFDRFSDAARFANRIFESPLLPAAVEVMNNEAFANLRIDNVPDYAPGAYVCAVALEAYPEAVSRMRMELKEMAKDANCTSDTVLQEDRHRPFWFGVGDLVPAVADRYKGLVSAQLNYPISNWTEILEFAGKTLSENKLDHTVVAHAGSGVCLINFLVDGNSSNLVGTIQKLLDKCREAGGNLVVQKAPAEMKRDLPIWGSPGSDVILMKRLKEKLDPQGIMSPGRYIEAG